MLATLLASAALAAAPFPETIPVPPASQPEGIATGKGTTFYVGSRAGRLGLQRRPAHRHGRGAGPGRAGRGAYGLKARGRQALRRRRPDRLRLRLRRAHRRERRRARLRRRVRQRRHGHAPGGVLHRSAEAAASTSMTARPAMPRRSPISGDLVYGRASTPTASRRRRNGKRLIIVQSDTGELFTGEPADRRHEADRGAATVTQRRRHPAARPPALRRAQPAQQGRRAATRATGSGARRSARR